MLPFSSVEILLHTISTLWAEASFSLTLWSAKCSLDHYQYAISIFPEIFFLTSCHKWAVYADRANTRLRAPVVRQFVPNELPCHTGATWGFEHCCSIFPESYRLFLTEALWRDAYLKYWLGSDQKATPTVSPLYFLISFFVFFLVSPLSVVVAKVVSWRSHVTWRSLFRQA